MAEAGLANLCKICNNNPPKYTCPRCSSRTCSLSCYKKHQTRSQCSGKRDPTFYKKRNDLATSSSIDHDFNFLTSIERAIDRGSKVTQKPLEGARGQNISKEKHLQQFLIEHDIRLRKAPKGMSRQKENSTHWVAKSKCVMWTVEWYLPDCTRILRNGRDTASLKDLFRANISNSMVKGQKRKRNAQADAKSDSTDRDANLNHQNLTSDALQTGVDSESQLARQQLGEEFVAQGLGRSPKTPEEKRTAVQTAGGDAVSSNQDQCSGLRFYLIKPETNGQSRVLQPLDGDQTLRSNLHGKTLLEFPSIQILMQSALELPAGFMLEEEYMSKYEQQIQEMDKESLRHTEPTLPSLGKGDKAPQQEVVSDQNLVESLMRDVAG